MKLKKKKKNSFPCDLSIGRSVWTELKALFHLPPNAFHGRGIARMKFSSGKLNVASRWKGPEGKHERAGRIVTGSKQNPVSRSKKERKNEKGKRERGRNWHGYIHIYISSDKQRKRVDSFTPKELFKRIVGGMRASFFQIRPERDTSYTFARYAYEIRTTDTYIYIHTQQKILLTYTSPLNRIIIHTIIIQVDVFVEIGCAIQKNMLLFLSIRILSFCNDIYIFVSRNINLLRTALFPISFSVLFQRNVLKIKKISTFDTILN